MKPETLHDRHRRTIADLAADYAKRGYDVVEEPKLEDTPEFLRPYLPDLIATKGDDRWIVDVKTPGLTRDNSDETTGAWARLSQEVAQHGWHFRLVVAKSDEDEVFSFAVPEAAEIEASLSDPPKLAGEGQEGAALLLAWSLFEAAARRRLLRDGHDAGRPTTPLGLAKILVHLGYVDDTELDALRDIIALRNQVAHGLFRAKVPTDGIADLMTQTRKLLLEEAA